MNQNGNVRLRGTDGTYTSSDNGNTESYGGDNAKMTSFTCDSLDREKTATVESAEWRESTTTDWWPSGDMKERTKDNGTVETRYFT